MGFSVALAGNPNVGKTAVFNAMTGLALSTGNYAGVTVERRHGQCEIDGEVIEIIDMPGAYSLAARSPDEMVVADVLLGQQGLEAPVDALLAVVDASNLERNLYLVSQLAEFDKPLVLALNMMDIAARRGIIIDLAALSEGLGVPVVPICAHKELGIAKLKSTLASVLHEGAQAARPGCVFPKPQQAAVQGFVNELGKHRAALGRTVPRMEAFRVLVDEGGYAEQRLLKTLGAAFLSTIQDYRRRAVSEEQGKERTTGSLAATEAAIRYAWVSKVMRTSVHTPSPRPATHSDRLDDFLTHRVFGTVFFLLVMLTIFETIFSGALPVMQGVEALVGWLGNLVGSALPEGTLRSLLVDGIISGVGSVVVFLPQIILLSLFIAVLEDFGYMARAALLMDKLMSWCGLSGQSFIPMLTCFACAVPGIMATRTIHSRRDRFTTILVAPLMSCSARLLIYTVMIAALIPDRRLLGGLIGLQGLTLFALYFMGIALIGPVAWLLKQTVLKGDTPPFILEMPSYKTPQAKSVFKKVYRESREFLGRAGTLIFSVSVIVWALAYFPHSPEITQRYLQKRAAVTATLPQGHERDQALRALSHEQGGEQLRNSVLGRTGRLLAPAFHPLGWDWHIATAVIAALPAREIFISTLGTLFHLEAEDDSGAYQVLTEKLRTVQAPDGKPLFGVPLALSVIVFMALCCQCAATIFTIHRETGQWRWPLLAFSYMTALAYLGAFTVYHGATWLGWGG